MFFFNLFRRKQLKSKLADGQLWGLAAGGLLTWINDSSFRILTLRTGAVACREGLVAGYGAGTAEEVRDVRVWLLTSGHHMPCMDVCHAARSGSSLGPPAMMDFARRNLAALERSQLIGFDMSRLVILARFAYTAGYIEEDEAWSWIREASMRIQRALSSWSELGDDFILGYEFLGLSGGAQIDDAARMADHWMRHSGDSPWNRIPWQTDLD